MKIGHIKSERKSMKLERLRRALPYITLNGEVNRIFEKELKRFFGGSNHPMGDQDGLYTISSLR